MTDEQYRKVVEQAHGLRLVARILDERGELDQALEAISLADAVAPVLDPTLYRDNADKMHEDRATIEAVRALARLERKAPA